MQNLKILNKKKIKEILSLLKKQWGIEKEFDYVFLMNEKNRIFIINKDISHIDLEKIRINSIGLYFGEIVGPELRLSIEASQIIGKYAEKNVITLDDKNARLWLKGNDLEKEEKVTGFAIIKNKNDFLGCGKYKDGKILNYVPKARRIMSSD